MTKRECLLYKREKNYLVCFTCEKRCKIYDEQYGFCKTRKNLDGVLYTLIYGDISSISANPIEKKPFYHFYPGTYALTVGSWSCNFTCPWCQNHEISKHPEYSGRGKKIFPNEFINLMEFYKCQGTCISFNEPTLLLEYAIDVFKLAKKKKYYNTFVTNGYMTEDALKILYDSGLDAMNIDIKGTEDIVKKYCSADLKKVWRNAILAEKLGIWIELTTLIIPGINDKEVQIKNIAKRIKSDMGDDVPWHITGYHPAYDFLNKKYVPPTPEVILERCIEIAKSEGIKYTYIGNILEHKYQNTYCPSCKKVLIRRSGFDVVENLFSANKLCPICGYKINIIF
ncbi:MAG: AmmeMemoRadiSam system radical SAM enzyme [Candidatus Goldbacteria bacterium]|nr:AmmeMemoRadiSam system radical SAM enzyme [Candidatus Goldiibacteriota bacterium]